MENVYLLKVIRHGAYHSVSPEQVLTAIENRNEAKRQHIKDVIEKHCGYFDGDDAVVLDDAVTKLLKEGRCTIGSDDEHTNKAKIVEMTHEDADYTFFLTVMEVH